MKNPPGPMPSHKNRPETMENRLSSHIVNITITRPHLTRRSQLACHLLSFPTLVSSYFQGLSSPWPPSPSPSLSPWPLAIIIMIIIMIWWKCHMFASFLHFSSLIGEKVVEFQPRATKHSQKPLLMTRKCWIFIIVVISAALITMKWQRFHDTLLSYLALHMFGFIVMVLLEI